MKNLITTTNTTIPDPRNLRGSAGNFTTAVYNENSLDYMKMTVLWGSDGAIGEHSCKAWLNVVTDGCDVPGPSSINWKHGGLISYDSTAVNATLMINPLVMRRAWDRGKAGNQQCYDVGTNNYMEQGTLQNSIGDFCTQSAAQPNGIANAGSTFTKIYNDGTPDRAILTTTWPQGALNYQVFKEECEYYMGVIK